jgi:hypothetical protein
VDVPLTLDQLAGLFVELDDDSQAQFFVKVAALMQSWTAHERNMQAFYIGRHLRDCTCSTEEGRELVTAIFEAMQPNATLTVASTTVHEPSDVEVRRAVG